MTGELQALSTYTRVLKKELPEECFEPVPARLWWMLPHGAVVLLGIGAIAFAGLHWAANLGLSLLVGLSFSCLGFLGHEILHGSVIAHPLLRNVVGGICFAHFNLGPKLWRKWHNAEHHGQAQSEKDPDTMSTLAEIEGRGSRGAFYRLPAGVRSLLMFGGHTVWFSVHAFQMLRRYYRHFEARERPILVLQFAAPLAVWLGLLAVIGPAKFVFAYVLPVMIANFIVVGYIATNHLLSPLTPVNDPLANSLTVSVPRWVNVLHLNFAYHAEHHIFPKMSPRFAPRVQALILKYWPERYHVMPHWKALLALWRTPRLYLENDSLIDPHRRLLYPVLGHGLNPDRIVGTPMEKRASQR